MALQHGIECTIDQASLSMNYLVKLIPVDSDLVQRPKANWTIVGCHGKIKNLVAYVKQRIERKDVENVSTLKCYNIMHYLKKQNKLSRCLNQFSMDNSEYTIYYVNPSSVLLVVMAIIFVVFRRQLKVTYSQMMALITLVSSCSLWKSKLAKPHVDLLVQ